MSFLHNYVPKYIFKGTTELFATHRGFKSGNASSPPRLGGTIHSENHLLIGKSVN